VVLGATMEERGFDASVTVLGVHDLLRDAAEAVPGVLELSFDGAIAGFRPGTPDNAPLLGALDDRLVAACGHHRNGILLTPLSAELIAAELAGEAEDHPFRPDRFEVHA
jgi:glycine oxidase